MTDEKIFLRNSITVMKKMITVMMMGGDRACFDTNIAQCSTQLTTYAFHVTFDELRRTARA